MRFTIITLILLLTALPAWATDTALVDRDGVTQPLVLSPANIGALKAADYKVKNVLTLGLKGDGSDEGAAIQALFNAASYGDVFYFPGGTYGSSVQINLPVGIPFRIVGDDRQKTWFKALSPMRSFFFMEGAASGRNTYSFEKFAMAMEWKADIAFNLRSGVFVGFDTLNIEAPKECGIVLGRPNAWSASYSYGQYQSVTYSGRIFYSKVAANLNHTPTVGGDTYWDDKEAVDTSKDSLQYQQKMKHVRLVSNSSQLADPATRMPFGIRLYASANDSSITDTSISNAAVASVFDESAYTFYESNWLVGSPVAHGAKYGIWLAPRFGESYDSGIIVKKLYVDGIGNNPGGGGAGLRLDRGGNIIQGSTFYNASGAGNGNYAFELANGITRTTISGNRFDAYIPYVFQSGGTYGAEFVWEGNFGGDNPASPDANASKQIFPKLTVGGQDIAAAAFLGKSGTGTSAATVAGTLTAGKQATFDANGNVIASSYDTGAAGGGGSGTVSSGTTGQFAYYSSTGTAVSGHSLTSGDVTGALGFTPPSGYPGAGIPNSTGSAWGTSYSVSTSTTADTIAKRDSGGGLSAINVASISGGGSSFNFKDQGATQALISKVGPNMSFIDLYAAPTDGTSDAFVRFGRNTNTTGKHYVQVLKGNNSSTANAQIGGNTDTYFAVDNSSVGIGTSTPASGYKLDVVGSARATTFTGTIPAATTYGATTTIDLALGDSPSVTLTGNTTLAFSNPKAGQWHRLNISQPSSGGTYNYTVTWPSTGLVCTWRNTASNAAPTLLTGANKVDTIIIHTLSTTSAECWTGGNK